MSHFLVPSLFIWYLCIIRLTLKPDSKLKYTQKGAVGMIAPFVLDPHVAPLLRMTRRDAHQDDERGLLKA